MAMNKPLVLIVEDEAPIREIIQLNLELSGFSTLQAVDGSAALQCLSTQHPDLILLDWMLPGIDGLTLLRKLKTDASLAAIPVIMITARGEESDVVLGLELGASDYIVKPFSNKVLIARIRALLRAAEQDQTTTIFTYRQLKIDVAQRRVFLEEAELSLTRTEFELLLFLCKRPGHVYTRDQLIDGIKGENYFVTDRSVDVQIANLRKKLGTFGQAIETVRGIGYKMK